MRRGTPVLLIALALVACVEPPRTARKDLPIVATWRARCGACHAHVEPGALRRGPLEEALSRHRTRVSLKSSEWAEMRDYLAAE
jgi:hypothetical protein